METKNDNGLVGMGHDITAITVGSLAEQVFALYPENSKVKADIEIICDRLLAYGGPQGKVAQPASFPAKAITPTILNTHRVLETLHRMLQTIQQCDSSDQLVGAGSALNVLKDGIMTKTSANDARAMTDLGDDVETALASLERFVAEYSNHLAPKPASRCSPLLPKAWLATLAGASFFLIEYYAAALDPAWSSMATTITGSDTALAHNLCADGVALASTAAAYGITKGLYQAARWFCCPPSKPSNQEEGLRQPGLGGGHADSLLEGGAGGRGRSRSASV